jgi:REP element-mobilizing transposase RayT
MKQSHYLLDTASQQVVLQSIQEICVMRQWELLAAHIRTNHVHVVIYASSPPETVMHAVKAHASKMLNRQQPGIKRWTRHGSTRYLWNDRQVSNAVNYILHEQGEPMAVFSNAADRSMLSRL